MHIFSALVHPFINSETKDNTCTLKNRNEWKKTFSENYIKPLLSTKCHLLSKHEFANKQQRPLKTTLWVRIDSNRQILRFKSINIKTPTQYAYLHIQECLTNTPLLLAKPVSFLNINDFKWTLVYKKKELLISQLPPQVFQNGLCHIRQRRKAINTHL